MIQANWSLAIHGGAGTLTRETITPGEEAGVRARLAARAVITLDRCEDGWCRLQSGRTEGWAHAEALFGVQDQAQCAASARPGRASRR